MQNLSYGLFYICLMSLDIRQCQMWSKKHFRVISLSPLSNTIVHWNYLPLDQVYSSICRIHSTHMAARRTRRYSPWCQQHVSDFRSSSPSVRLRQYSPSKIKFISKMLVEDLEYDVTCGLSTSDGTLNCPNIW